MTKRQLFMQTTKKRCSWCGNDEDYITYHDTIWGTPEYDSKKLFAMLILEGQQAGLSWITILRKQKAIEAEFEQLDPYKLAAIKGTKREDRIARALQNPEIIRNKLKVNAVFQNADAYVALTEAEESFSQCLWQFVDGKPLQNTWKDEEDIPAFTSISKEMSAFLKKSGFKFVGPTIMYAFMQAMGLVNDHIISCWRHEDVQ